MRKFLAFLIAVAAFSFVAVIVLHKTTSREVHKVLTQDVRVLTHDSLPPDQKPHHHRVGPIVAAPWSCAHDSDPERCRRKEPRR